MYYVGVDLHKETATFSVRDQNGRNIVTKACSTSQRILRQTFRNMPRPFDLGVEATYNWYYFIDLARQYAQVARLGHSLYIKAFARRHKKTDRIDAELISWLLWKGVFPEAHVTSIEGRRVKERIRLYCNMVGDRTRVIARGRAFMDRHGRPLPEGTSMTTLKGAEEARRLKWSDEERDVLEGYLEEIEFLTAKINARRSSMRKMVDEDEDMKRIATIPGMDMVAAFIVRAEIDDISRFRNSARFIAYCGLAPRTVSSAGKRARAALMKNASHYLRWIFIQNASVFSRACKGARQKWIAKAKKTNATKARLEAARRLCKITYAVLKEKRNFLETVEHEPKAAQRVPPSNESQGKQAEHASPCTV